MWRRTKWFLGLAMVLCCSLPSTKGELDRQGGGGGRTLLGFTETQGNASFHCSPSGPCLSCQYSEKNDEKYRCSETGYRLPLKCVEVQDGGKEGTNHKQRQLSALEKPELLLKAISNYKWRKLLDNSSSGKQSYITYRSCVPVDDEEKLSFLGFEVIMVGLLLISGSVVYLRQKRTAVMPGAGAIRIPTNPPRF
ncbi:uncharacterized protein [Typha angustifolia]|uniref:uncharacterized protein n=1 Tax=Typha angustifolia TaxID=59011 RepID=UPI003C2C27B2